jgi:virulence-associated protein VapD
MYAIVFDLDTATLEQTYPTPSWRNAYSEVRSVLEQRGFEWQQGSTYFGGDQVTAVDCVLAVQALKRAYNWFQPSVRDIRMLRIEENNDLSPALN